MPCADREYNKKRSRDQCKKKLATYNPCNPVKVDAIEVPIKAPAQAGPNFGKVIAPTLGLPFRLIQFGLD